jgi:hypothetical protein
MSDVTSGTSDTSGASETSDSVVVNSEEQSQEQQAAPAPTNKRKYAIKVDGADEEVELDFDDTDTIKRHLQMSRVAQKRMSAAAQEKQRAEQFFSMLKSDPIKVLNDPSIGVNFREIAEKYLAEQLEAEIMSPQERKLKEAERIIRERDEEQKSKRDQEQRSQVEKLQEHYSSEYDKKISEALSTSGLPKTPKTVQRMAQLMYKNLEHGLDLEPKDLVALVKEDYLSEIRSLFGQTDGDGLLALLGDDVANKIRKSDLKRLKSSNLTPSRPNQTNPEPIKRESRPMSRDEWRAELDKRVKS